MQLRMSMLISNIEREINQNFNNKKKDFLLSSIVGDDDGGALFSPEEYENYKKQVLPMVKKRTIDSY